MRALFLTASAVIGLIAAGIVFLAVSPKPRDIALKVVLPIDPDAVAKGRKAVSSGQAGDPGPRDAIRTARIDDIRSQADKSAEKSSDSAGSAALSAEDGSDHKGGAKTEAATPEPETLPPTLTITQFLADEPESDTTPGDKDEGPAKADEALSASEKREAETGDKSASPDKSRTEREAAPAATIETGSMRSAPDIPERRALHGPDARGGAAASAKKAEIVADRSGTQTETGDSDKAGAVAGGWTVAAVDTGDSALPAGAAGNKPSSRIILLIRGLGVDERATKSAIEDLPPEVSLAFVPYGNKLAEWAKKARKSKHEILVQIPLEPNDYPANNPGPHTLLTSLSTEENLKRLDWLLGRFDQFTGVTNYLGGKIGASPGAFAPILMEMKSRGLVYLDDGKTALPATQMLVSQLSLPYATANLIIDSDPSPEKIEAALEKIAAIAREKGLAVAIGHAFPATISVVKKWLKRMERDGIVIAPVSQLSRMAKG